jgi:leader peptidase (prepilin peptidase) / N-methyltransferase
VIPLGSAPATTPASSAGTRLPSPSVVLPIALILAILAFVTFPVDHALVAAFVAGVLVLLSAIDIERGVIPNRIVIPATCVVLLAQIALFPDRALEWLLTPIIVALVLAIPQLLGRRWMGMGDVKLALLLGAALGWAVIGALLVGFLCVFPVALLVLIRGGAAARKSTVPFGPFLSLGALIVLFGPHLAGLPTS